MRRVRLSPYRSGDPHALRFELMPEALRQILTGKDNTTHDLARWLAVASFAVGLGLSIYDTVWRGHPFSLQEFGIGIGSMMAGVGAAIKLKEASEP